ncbi:hypothetical protein IG631_09174 [Alternaria alternata]|nr:hypothetical protein IG631_09174 [Alternaria alternata]
MAVGNSAMSLERVKERRRSVCVCVMMMYWREGEIGVRRQVPDAAWLGIARLLCHLRCTRPSGMPVLDSADLSVTAWLRNTTLSKINLFPSLCRVSLVSGTALLLAVAVSSRHSQPSTPSRDSPDRDTNRHLHGHDSTRMHITSRARCSYSSSFTTTQQHTPHRVHGRGNLASLPEALPTRYRMSYSPETPTSQSRPQRRFIRYCPCLTRVSPWNMQLRLVPHQSIETSFSLSAMQWGLGTRCSSRLGAGLDY